MSPDLPATVARVLDGLLGVILLTMLLALVRLLRGPSLPDRAIAMDVLVMAGVAGMAVLAWQTGLDAVLDVAVVVALVTFLSAVALAWYLKRSEP